MNLSETTTTDTSQPMKLITHNNRDYFLPNWVRYVAEDSKGGLHGFEDIPEPTHNGWKASTTSRHFIAFPCDMAWRNSLKRI